MCLKCAAKHTVSTQRRGFLKFAGLGFAVSALPAYAADPVLPKPDNVISPDAALDRLIKGNARYVANATRPADHTSTRAALAKGQNPYACLLSCADSRIAPELCFDAERGDLFVTRVAGNYVTPPLLASLEYGTAVLQAPLIVVLGHTSCGAIGAAIKAEEGAESFPGHIQNLTSDLAPAVRAALKTNPADLLQAAVRENVILGVQSLQESTPVLRKRVRAGQLKVVGGIYNLENGKVEFLNL